MSLNWFIFICTGNRDRTLTEGIHGWLSRKLHLMNPPFGTNQYHKLDQAVLLGLPPVNPQYLCSSPLLFSNPCQAELLAHSFYKLQTKQEKMTFPLLNFLCVCLLGFDPQRCVWLKRGRLTSQCKVKWSTTSAKGLRSTQAVTNKIKSVNICLTRQQIA